MDFCDDTIPQDKVAHQNFSQNKAIPLCQAFQSLSDFQGQKIAKIGIAKSIGA